MNACCCQTYEGDCAFCPSHGTRAPTVTESLMMAGLAATSAVARHQKKNSRRRGSSKKECTPCAAQAYVDALRGSQG